MFFAQSPKLSIVQFSLRLSVGGGSICEGCPQSCDLTNFGGFKDVGLAFLGYL